MKKLFVLIPSLLLSLSVMSAEKKCIFSDSTGILDTDESANIAHFERLGLSLKKRFSPRKESELKGAMNRKLMAEAYYDYNADMEIDTDIDETDAIIEWIGSDGYIQWISCSYKGYSGFAVVASYPGDNEHGYIYGLKKKDGKTNISIVAKIGDSSIESCKIFK